MKIIKSLFGELDCRYGCMRLSLTVSIVSIVALLISIDPAIGQRIEGKNSCIDCHIKSTGVEKVDIQYHQWKDSWHSARGVTCDRCHQGHPEKDDKAAAHASRLESERKGTPSYFMALDRQCGICHENEFDNFKVSTHFRFLQKSMGPNCTSCHHPKTGHTLTIDEISSACANCHNKELKEFEYIPTETQMVLVSMERAKVIVNWAEEFITISDIDRTQKAWARSKVKAAQYELSQGSIQWHLFNLANIRKHIDQAVRFSKEAKDLLRKKP